MVVADLADPGKHALDGARDAPRAGVGERHGLRRVRLRNLREDGVQVLDVGLVLDVKRCRGVVGSISKIPISTIRAKPVQYGSRLCPLTVVYIVLPSGVWA